MFTNCHCFNKLWNVTVNVVLNVDSVHARIYTDCLFEKPNNNIHANVFRFREFQSVSRYTLHSNRFIWLKLFIVIFGISNLSVILLETLICQTNYYSQWHFFHSWLREVGTFSNLRNFKLNPQLYTYTEECLWFWP